MTNDQNRLSLTISEDELSLLIGTLYEAVFELNEQEFATRVGWTADEARALGSKLREIRATLERDRDGES